MNLLKTILPPFQLLNQKTEDLEFDSKAKTYLDYEAEN